jgi:ABC-type polar amino acid transport system ATPase subunit
MAIDRVELKDFLVFKGGFTMNFCSGVNVLIGANATGKTTLMKGMYALCESTKGINIFSEYFSAETNEFYKKPFNCLISIGDFFVERNYKEHSARFEKSSKFVTSPVSAVYIPEKDILSNAKGLPETYEFGKAQYTQCEVDIVKKARVLADSPEQPLFKKICEIIGGRPENDGQSFFMARLGMKKPIPFSMEASGYRKFGLLAALIRNEQIKPGAVVFWDEPENSLNPELLPKLADILLELSRDGVQIFIATHSEVFAAYLAVNRQEGDEVVFHSLFKDSDQIKSTSDNRFDLLAPNTLTAEQVKLYMCEVERGLG